MHGMEVVIGVYFGPILCAVQEKKLDTIEGQQWPDQFRSFLVPILQVRGGIHHCGPKAFFVGVGFLKDEFVKYTGVAVPDPESDRAAITQCIHVWMFETD